MNKRRFLINIQFKKQFKIIYLCLITFIGLLFVVNNYQLMAMNNNESGTSNTSVNKIRENASKKS
ncbi:SVM family protein [Italian clover phyllody phytoplasma]|uniref:SVM family protein n=1 Tax=Italian clover phyllody phytoplasma TaxID=1196420 RepID=UPI000A065E3C|nr:SVM family protein [Italian clover phyllody phytoplasma]